MAEAAEKKKGFWSLFRTKSLTARTARLEKSRPNSWAASGASDPVVRRRSSRQPEPATEPRRRVRRPDATTAKGKGRDTSHGFPDEPGPLTAWPPPGVGSRDELSRGHAMALISAGVPAFRGYKRPVPHASDHYYALFATVAGNKRAETDAADQHDAMTQLMTLRLLGPGKARKPWETLEQPSYAFCFGKRPGTITLNHWVSRSSALPPPVALRDPGVSPRDVELDRVLGRIKELERGLEEDDEELMYRGLYRRFLRDPDKLHSPHKSLDRQITDLLMVLSRADWIDFTNPKNQIVTRFIFDPDPDSRAVYAKFFHQLLLSMELDLRINSKQHLDEAKEKLLLQIPPTIQWNLALARRWRDYVRIEEYGKTEDEVRLRMKLKQRQAKMLKRFAQMLKWPNLLETLDELRRLDAGSSLDLVSSHTMAFFSGLVLPGPTFPFLIMNSLIDVDPDPATDQLALLTHLHPHCGFQYRNSYTYWTATSVVGKVLAPTCRSVAGWVGPARPTVDLARSQIARVRCRPARERLPPEDVVSMFERSDPLGPPASTFPVAEYDLPLPDFDNPDDVDIRVELLSLRACSAGPASEQQRGHRPEPGPGWYDASVQFAIDGVSWPIPLSFDVAFVCAWPCSGGPHPLFFDYAYAVVRAAELACLRGWTGSGSRTSIHAGRSNGAASAATGGASGDASGREPADSEDGDDVLVIEAFGVPDNEVLARAWCSRQGLSAIVADVSKTCMACAIREAYAATLTVVILVDDERDPNRDD